MPMLTVREMADKWSLDADRLFQKLQQLGIPVSGLDSQLNENAQATALERLWLWHSPTQKQRIATDAWVEAQLEVCGVQLAPGEVPLGGDYWQGTYPVARSHPAESPVWGIADTHAHIVSHCGFGGVTIAGDTHADANTPEAAMAVALGPCRDFHDPINNPENVHAKDGYPTFDGWPRFTTRAHQQAYVTWLRRAFEGGLRLICCLAVNNEYLARFMASLQRERGVNVPKDRHFDDTNIEEQIEALHALVAYVDESCGGDGWLTIATSPAAAREIIHQGKLAVVLGIEVDDLGGWTKGKAMFEDRPLSDDPTEARAQIRRLLQYYYDLGVRQCTPIHLADNLFGGCAVYNKAFELIQEDVTGQYHEVENAWEEGIRYRLDQDRESTALMFAAAAPLDVLAGWRWHPEDGQHWSHMNAQGLTEYGKMLLEEMASIGMIIDLDHMSQKTTTEALQHIRGFKIAEDRDDSCPVLSSHTGLRELALAANVPFDGKRNQRDAYGTNNIHHVANESQKSAEQLQAIRELGGMVAPILNQSLLQESGPYVSDCPRSAKDWAIAFQYAVEQMGERNVALGSDLNGMVEFPGPRFGPFVAYGLLHAHRSKQRRRESAAIQVDGIHYKGLPRGVRKARFDHDKVYSKLECDVWQAIVFLASGLSLDEREPGRRCADMLKGFRAKAIHDTTNQTQRAAWYIANATRQELLSLQGGDSSLFPADTSERLIQMARSIGSIWLKWSDMLGPNEPLQRCYAGHKRDFDYNIDGLAHYGLLPDFLQELKNVGLEEKHMKVLFRSAEDYICLWQRCEQFIGSQPIQYTPEPTDRPYEEE